MPSGSWGITPAKRSGWRSIAPATAEASRPSRPLRRRLFRRSGSARDPAFPAGRTWRHSHRGTTWASRRRPVDSRPPTSFPDPRPSARWWTWDPMLVLLRAPAQSEIENPLEEPVVRKASGFGGVGEVLAVGELGIGIRLENVDLLLLVHAKVDSRVAAEIEVLVDTLRELLDPLRDRGREPFGFSRFDAVLSLIARVPFDALGGDCPRALGKA